MNIKIDKDLRVRISEDEFSEILKNNFFEKNFKIEPCFDFWFQIKVVEGLSGSEYEAVNQKIILKINRLDFLKLNQVPFQKKGLQINQFNLQCDLFDSVKIRN